MTCEVPSTVELDRLHHVAIPVEDIAKAVAWYRDRLRCQVEYHDDSWALLRFGNLAVALVLPDQHPPHFAVVRSDAAGFGALTTHRDGTRSTYLRDPSGNAIEILDADSL